MPAGGSDSDFHKSSKRLSPGYGSYGRIDSHTVLYAVLGDPVSHSLGPVMHNRAFAYTGHNGVYVALRVTDPAGALTGIRALHVAGASVTIPHKTAVIDYLDRMDPAAEAIGAVNTIVNRKGTLIGYNTDGAGAVRALTGKTRLKEKRVALIGAGGTARAIGHAVSEQGARVTIVNRTTRRGKFLAGDLRVDFVPLNKFTGHACDVIINTTPVGMHPRVHSMPIDETVLRPNMVVMDAVYNPLVTQLLRVAGRTGCVTISGVEMFIHQGAAQYELWTGMPAPVEVMRSAVLAALYKLGCNKQTDQ